MGCNFDYHIFYHLQLKNNVVFFSSLNTHFWGSPRFHALAESRRALQTEWGRWPSPVCGCCLGNVQGTAHGVWQPAPVRNNIKHANHCVCGKTPILYHRETVSDLTLLGCAWMDRAVLTDSTLKRNGSCPWNVSLTFDPRHPGKSAIHCPSVLWDILLSLMRASPLGWAPIQSWKDRKQRCNDQGFVLFLIMNCS